MPTLDVSFSIVESSDATSFNIKNTGDTYVPSSTLTLYIGNSTVTMDWEFEITGDNLTSFNSSDGLDITCSDCGYTDSTFEDEVYYFRLADNSVYSEYVVEGFASVITDSVFKESLTYRIYQTSAQKDYINEKIRLLNNLGYAAYLGDADKFRENLEMLQLLE